MKPENYAKLSPAAKKLYDNPKFEFEILTSGEHAGMLHVIGWVKSMPRPNAAALQEIKAILLEEKAERDAEEAREARRSRPNRQRARSAPRRHPRREAD